MKKCLAFLLSALLFMGIFAGCGPTENAGDKPLVIWSYDVPTTEAMVEEYKKVYPDAQFEVVPVDGNSYEQLLQTALFVESDVPDIIWGDYFSRGKIFSLGVCEDLSKAPYNLDTSLVSDWVIELCKNEQGELLGIESGPAPTGLLFKRDICLQYLGTDDEAELSEMFSTWDGFLNACRKIYNDSNHTVVPFASIGDVYCVVVGMLNIPYMVDGKQNIDAVCDGVFPLMEIFVKEGLCGRIDQWTAAYYSSYNNSKYAFHICPAWCPDYHIKENAPDQAGNFGICLPAGGKMFSFGGTSYSIYKGSSNKEAAWQFIQWALLTEEGQRNTQANIIANGGSGGVGTLATLYNDPMYDREDAFFGGQNILKFFTENMDKVNARPLTKYDTAFSDSLGLVLNSMKNGLSAADCKTKVMDELRLKLPELFK